MGISSFKFLWWASTDASFLQQSAYRPFKVIQGRVKIENRLIFGEHIDKSLMSCLTHSIYTVFQKNQAPFTDRLSRKFAIQSYVDIPPRVTYVATLPCET